MRSSFLTLAAMAGVASAQLLNTTCTVPTYTQGGAPQTITQTYTSTYCPACPSVVTTYTTVYSQFCPTGLSGQVYTVQETCAPGGCRTGLAPGFTTTVATCNVCGPTPVTATLTQPCTACAQATQVQQYPVTYQTFGPSGLAPATYTVTASCAATPCPVAQGAPAPGFTQAVETCTTCGATPVTATLTVPVATNVAAVNNGGAAAAPAAAATGAAAAPAAGNGAQAAPAAAAYTGAASSNKAASYLLAGVAGFAAVIRLF